MIIPPDTSDILPVSSDKTITIASVRSLSPIAAR